jgi:probable HAF family extracellular repeat protein
MRSGKLSCRTIVAVGSILSVSVRLSNAVSIMKCPLALIAMILLTSKPQLNAAPATFTPLGLFGGIRTRGHDISADGSVVIGTVFEGADVFRLFRWSATENTLGPLTQDFPAQSRVGLSADGTVAIGTRPSGLPPHSVAFRWDEDGSVSLLGRPPILTTDVGSIARDVSANGSVIVGSMGTLSGNPEAFRWTEATGMVGLGGLPGAEVWSTAKGVSPDGGVIVGLVLDANNSGQAFRWTAQNGMVALSRPALATAAGAENISADGSVIIGDMVLGPPPGSPADPQRVAFRWTSATGMVSLGDLPGASVASEALDVSADGSVIVGIGETTAGPGAPTVNEAFYWTTDAGMRNLREVLVSFGATNLDGWLLTEAQGVSADGLTVVGTAISPAGVQQAFVATIPEPSSIVLAAFAVAGIVCFVRSKTASGLNREPVTTRTVLSATIRKLKTRSKIMDERLAHPRG